MCITGVKKRGRRQLGEWGKMVEDTDRWKRRKDKGWVKNGEADIDMKMREKGDW